MDRVGATNPFHIGRAYGLSRSSAAEAAPATRSPAGSSFKASIASIGTTARADSVDPSTARIAAAKQRIGTLVAARVTEQPETAPSVTQPRAAASPSQSGSAFPMYRHPADKNAAATAVNAGRVLDLNA